jgi:hypothetical protein
MNYFKYKRAIHIIYNSWFHNKYSDITYMILNFDYNS